MFSGSGIRIKIIESMALARAVISTTIGAEGINITNGENIIIADNKDDFFEAIKFMFAEPAKVEELGRKARLLIEEEHNTEKIISKLEAFYRQIL
ncbi:MAG: hypothetical protein C0595_11255 [Marinilabiliales bacterium]|nr:MAG: hypothetical protein C0595_11255 [Marinilabiliales bacterium]